jgi:hypothetical protein
MDITIIETFNLISAVVSGVLAIVALWLALYFYKASRQQAELAQTNASEIAASVGRLEKLFDRLYSDTFSIMRDTVADMRMHIWRPKDGQQAGESVKQLQEKANEQISAATEDILQQIVSSTSGAGVTTEQVTSLKNQIEPKIVQALEASSAAAAEFKAQTSFLDASIRSYLASPRGARGAPRSVVAEAVSALGFRKTDVEDAISRGLDEGWINSSRSGATVGQVVTLAQRP